MSEDALDIIRANEAEIEGLRKKYGVLKVNLSDDGKDVEGIWATPSSQKDKDFYDSEKPGDRGKPFNVRLLNSALHFLPHNSWGIEIVARNNGSSRPIADAGENKERISQLLEE